MSFRRHIAVSALFILAALAFPASAYAEDCSIFSRNLKVGMTGDDVLLMQKTLNKTVGVRIAESGPGAPGEETTYFGMRTRLAVIQFQNLYRNEVLIPVGLTSGSGYVGSMTRAKLQTVCVGEIAKEDNSPAVPISSLIPPQKPITSVATSTSTPKPTPPPVTPLTQISTFAFADWVNAPDAPLEFFYANAQVLSPGDKLQITGRGFTGTGNTVHIGAFTIDNISPVATNTITVTLPTTTPKGKFDVWVSNKTKGESNKRFLVVREKNIAPPTVTSYSPTSGPLGTIVTVVGTGFAQKNDIRLSNRIITDVPSTDGKTLSFPIETPEIAGSYAGFDMPGVDKEIPFWFYIVNVNGVSAGKAFNVKI